MKINQMITPHSKNVHLIYLFLLAIGLHSNLMAQTEPTIDLEKQDPSCSGNGRITALLQNSDNAGNLVYNLFQLPSETLLASNANGFFEGLDAGLYKLSANFTIDDSPQEISVEETLNSVYNPLSFTVISKTICENELGSIEVFVNEGAPASYELLGPSERPAQESNVFEDLMEGAYTIIVTDECGDRLSQSFEIQKAAFFIDENYQGFENTLNSCNEINVGHLVKSVGASISYPLYVNYVVHTPMGTTEEINTEITTGDPSENIFFNTLPFYYDEAYTYDLKITDNCGQVSTLEGISIDRKLTISNDLLWGAGSCGKRRLSIKPSNFTAPFTINFTEFPDGFDPEIFNSQYPGPFTEENIFFGSTDMPIPTGNYAFTLEDACGHTASISKELLDKLSGPGATVYKGCGPDMGSVQLNSFDFEFTTVELTSAPASFSGSLPLDVTNNISSVDPRRFYMNSLPEGEYEFTSYTSCKTTHLTKVTIEGIEVIENQIDIIENCGAFNIFLKHEDNSTNGQAPLFGIQKLDPSSGEWGHPETGQVYNPTDPLTNENAILLVNGATNINQNYSGTLRLVKSLNIWKMGEDMMVNRPQITYCLETLKTFEIKEKSTFNSINTFKCSGDNYEVSVNAEGYLPITYKIVEKDGLPFIIDNGEDPLFKGLESGRYKLQLEDACGNLTNTSVQVKGENLPKIIPENLCEGENGALLIKNLDFLEFEWYKEGDPENILSTNSRLEFPSFNLSANAGTYYVQISDNNPESCVNKTLEFTIDTSSLNPDAGEGQEVEICKGEIINLFDYLSGPYDNYGTWKEITNSGNLIENTWSSDDLSPGTYTFEYTITGICSGEKSTVVTINLTDVPEVPKGNAIQEFCSPGQYTLASLVVEGTNIQWHTSPLGEEILPEETILQNGRTYYATQSNGTCFSDERLAVEVLIHTQVENNMISAEQTLYQMEKPEEIIGTEPQGGSGKFTYIWEQKTEGSEWEIIEGAKRKDYSPKPLLETTSFRRTTSDELCGDFISNELTIEVLVAPIVANDDYYGPLINYESYLLPTILLNDSLKNKPILPEDIRISVLSIKDEDGNNVTLDNRYSMDTEGVISLPEDITAGNYIVRYSICQEDVPANCSEANIILSVIGISIDAAKTIDRTQALPGDIVNYTVRLKNTSTFSLDKIILTEILPEELMLLSASPALSPSNTWEISNLAPEETVELGLSVMPTIDGNFTNEVNIKVENYDQTIQSEELQVRPKMVDMAIEKTSFNTTVNDGSSFDYQITVTNNGPDPADNVRIVDFLPAQLAYESAVFDTEGLLSSPTFTQADDLLVWNVPQFDVDATLTITLTVKAIGDGRIRNRAEVSADGQDILPENNTSIEVKTILPLFIPNVFKPDGDGKNETFVIRAAHRFERLELVIFNRWGDIVYSSKDYQNNWYAEGLLPGTYYYQVKGVDFDKKEKQYKGWVQVIK
ncbi:MAG: DUF11 domain-containing protein [Cytophagales bacterium]|uniref:T9SS type B sorting domain-containing protein n=1 Tax=Cyclobacterium marinum TaxID=104 RepID=UPI0030D8D8E8|nr:DUF11 domain-containing protein [Cytophagales bacterium]|tara:strand:+ start:32116 stop:36483 length:4368 start_codon:yes stop_codon:yes gene_type:complete